MVERRTEVLQLRVRPAERRAIEKLAAAAGLKAGAFAREALFGALVREDAAAIDPRSPAERAVVELATS